MTLANLLETIGVRAVVVGTIGQLSALKGVLDPITAVPLPNGRDNRPMLLKWSGPRYG